MSPHPLLRDVLQALEWLAPLSLAEDWDNVGLLLGDPQQPVQRGMTCLTLTPDVAEEAIQQQVSVIVTHHPILFKAVQRLTAETPSGKMLLSLVRAGIAVYSAHTAYDSATAGINQQLAEALELSSITPLRPKPDGTGSGRQGQWAQALSLADVLSRVKQVLRLQALQYVGTPDQLITRVGIACGSAAEFLPDAAAAGCQALMTGEARFHDALRARELGLALILPGHYATERFAQESLAAQLQAAFPQCQWHASQVEADPVLYG